MQTLFELPPKPAPSPKPVVPAIRDCKGQRYLLEFGFTEAEPTKEESDEHGD